MTEQQWDLVVGVFRQVRCKRGAKGRDDRLFLKALHYFVVCFGVEKGLIHIFGAAGRKRMRA